MHGADYFHQRTSGRQTDEQMSVTKLRKSWHLIVDGKSEIELSSQNIEISRKFKEEVVQPILKVLPLV